MPYTYRDGVYTFSEATRQIVWLHDIIMGCPPSPGMLVRHKNGDVFDNRRENLEWCRPSEPEFCFLTKRQLMCKMKRLEKECTGDGDEDGKCDSVPRNGCYMR